MLAWWALARRRSWLAGLALGLLWCKPTLAAGAAALLLLAGEWQALAGIVGGAALQLVVAWSWAGTTVMGAYARTLTSVVTRGGIPASQPEHLHSLSGFWRLLLGDGPLAPILSAIIGIVVVVGAARVWRLSHDDPSLRIAAVALVVVLTAPSLRLRLGGAGAGSRGPLDMDRACPWPSGRQGAAMAHGGGRGGALSGPIAAATAIQVSTVALAGLLLLECRALSRRRQAASTR